MSIARIIIHRTCVSVFACDSALSHGFHNLIFASIGCLNETRSHISQSAWRSQVLTLTCQTSDVPRSFGRVDVNFYALDRFCDVAVWKHESIVAGYCCHCAVYEHPGADATVWGQVPLWTVNNCKYKNSVERRMRQDRILKKQTLDSYMQTDENVCIDGYQTTGSHSVRLDVSRLTRWTLWIWSVRWTIARYKNHSGDGVDLRSKPKSFGRAVEFWSFVRRHNPTGLEPNGAGTHRMFFFGLPLYLTVFKVLKQQHTAIWCVFVFPGVAASCLRPTASPGKQSFAKHTCWKQSPWMQM
jgi:hypothetical protein